jgi:xanthine dehydrogenase molybdopterin-binding subunit B
LVIFFYFILGGGFGGKEFSSVAFAALAGLCSYNTKKPCRIQLERDIDFIIKGQRPSILSKFKIYFNKNGKIVYYENNVFLNSGFIYIIILKIGNSETVGVFIIDHLMFLIDNTYKIENLNFNSFVCKTNLPMNTSMRGFGHPEVKICFYYNIDFIYYRKYY